MAGALVDLRVLDLAHGVAGSYAAMLLAGQGADVLRLEGPKDRLRGTPAYHVFNRDKRIERLADESLVGGRIAALAYDADVVVVDLPEAVAAAHGLDYARLSREQPRLILLAMPPYGSRGPLAGADADEALVAAVAGLSGGQWSGSEQPVDLVLPIAGYGAALLGSAAVSAAMYERAHSGRGQRVEVSWLAGALAMQTGSLLRGAGVERLAGTVGNPLGAAPVYRVYRAADGEYLFIAAGTPRFFQRLCLLLDHPEWISDERWSAAPWGIINPDDRQALADEIAPLIAAKPRAEWLRLLSEADIPNAMIATREEFIAHPQTIALGARAEVNDPEAGATVQMGAPVRLYGTPGPEPSALAIVEGATFTKSSEPAGARAAVSAGAPGEPDSEGGSHNAPEPARGGMGVPAGVGPLAGVRVLDLSGFIAGAYAPMTLADFGAEVLKVESPEGDAFRSFGFGFLGWNRGKRAISVDPRRPEGPAILHELVRSADVLVENFRPGGAAKLGLDYDTLKSINPRLIYASVSGFGDIGPEAGSPGFDPLLQARSGVMAAQGGMERGHPPVYLTVAISDYAAALLAAYGVCAALVARERTGLGQRVETTLAQSAMAAQAGEFIFYDGRPPWLTGAPARLGETATDRLYAAADGWLRLSVHTAAQWSALAGVLQDAALATILPAEALSAPVDGLIASSLAAAFFARPLAEWLASLEAASVPAAVVVRPADLFTDPQTLANDLITRHEHAVWGEVRQSNVLAHFSRTPGLATRAAPLLGQHSRDVLREAGFSDERIEAFIRDGVVVQA